MDFEKPGNPKQFQRIRMFRPISSVVSVSKVHPMWTLEKKKRKREGRTLL